MKLLAATRAIGTFVALSSVVGCTGAQPTAARETRRAESWPAHTSDGQPDIQGLWSSNTGWASLNMEPLGYLATVGMPQRRGRGPVSATTAQVNSDRLSRTLLQDPPDHVLPYQPWAKARRDAILKDYLRPSPAQVDPQTRGWPDGVPRINYYSEMNGSAGGPIQILQPPGYVVFFYETQHEFRVVPLDGRPHVGQGIKLWMGDSRGRWEGNTLVVDVTNHNDSTRFNVVGDFHSDAMRVTERWTYVDRDTLQYQATIDDSRVYTKPWTLGVAHKRNTLPGNELMEYAGVEGEKDAALAIELFANQQARGQQK